MKWKSLGLVAAGLATAIVPVTVLAGPANAPIKQDFTESFQAAWGTDAPVATDKGSFKPIARMPQGAEIGQEWNHPAPLYVSVDLESGKAAVRVKGSFGTMRPSSVTFSGKGVQTATFFGTQGVEDPTIEWKRMGDAKVRAASVVASITGELD